jgi:hypothetical protein
MPDTSPRSLKIALQVVGVVFIVGPAVFTRIWPSGWIWHPENSAYLQMIFSIYVTLGIFLMRAARDPARHLSLIWFAIWSSVAHALVMGLHAFTDPGEMGHLPGDVAGLLVIAAVLAVLVVRSGVRATDTVAQPAA